MQADNRETASADNGSADNSPDTSSTTPEGPPDTRSTLPSTHPMPCQPREPGPADPLGAMIPTGTVRRGGRTQAGTGSGLAQAQWPGMTRSTAGIAALNRTDRQCLKALGQRHDDIGSAARGALHTYENAEESWRHHRAALRNLPPDLPTAEDTVSLGHKLSWGTLDIYDDADPVVGAVSDSDLEALERAKRARASWPNGGFSGMTPAARADWCDEAMTAYANEMSALAAALVAAADWAGPRRPPVDRVVLCDWLDRALAGIARLRHCAVGVIASPSSYSCGGRPGTAADSGCCRWHRLGRDAADLLSTDGFTVPRSERDDDPMEHGAVMDSGARYPCAMYPLTAAGTARAARTIAQAVSSDTPLDAAAALASLESDMRTARISLRPEGTYWAVYRNL